MTHHCEWQRLRISDVCDCFAHIDFGDAHALSGVRINNVCDVCFAHINDALNKFRTHCWFTHTHCQSHILLIRSERNWDPCTTMTHERVPTKKKENRTEEKLAIMTCQSFWSRNLSWPSGGCGVSASPRITHERDWHTYGREGRERENDTCESITHKREKNAWVGARSFLPGPHALPCPSKRHVHTVYGKYGCRKESVHFTYNCFVSTKNKGTNNGKTLTHVSFLCVFVVSHMNESGLTRMGYVLH